jgi:hypothetical protein
LEESGQLAQQHCQSLARETCGQVWCAPVPF